jgi:leucine dehydrogenase
MCARHTSGRRAASAGAGNARRPHVLAFTGTSFPPIDRYLATLDHEEMLVRRGSRSGLFCFVAVHSTVRGPSLGGCRMWSYDDSRLAIRDVLRLSRAMTFKNAAADLPLGGGKGAIMLPAGRDASPSRRRDALLDFGDTVDALGGRYVTAEDVGTSARDIALIAERTPHVAGLSRRRGGSGDPSPWTALGVHVSIEVACEEAFGSRSVRGRSVAVLGLGHVGGRLAQRLARAGAKLVVSDVDASKRALADRLGARWVTPERALTADVDVLAPCALGGILDDESVPALRCRVVAGAANNQLADDAIADLLHTRGIVWAPDFIVNAGGIVSIAVELEPGGYDPKRARVRVRAIGDTLAQVFADARAIGATPLTAAMELARRRLREAAAA